MMTFVPRVLHIIDASTPADMLDQLSLLAGGDDTVVSIGPRPCGWFDLPVVAVHRLFGSAAVTGWRMREVVGPAEIVHAWSPAGARAGEAAAKAVGAKRVVSVPCRPPPPALRRLVKRTRRGALTITVPTSACRDAFARAGADEAAVRLLPPPARATDQRAARRKSAREALGLAGEHFLIASPAELTRPAGHKYASWAHAVVRQVRPQVRLLFPRGGPDESHVRFFAETTSYGDEALFTGSRLSRADALAAADAAVFFAERDVGVAALIAAMAAGLPIAATDTPDITECTGQGEAVLLVPRGDMSEGFIARGASSAVLKLMEDGKLADSLAAAARRRAEECFSPAASRAILADIYYCSAKRRFAAKHESAALRHSGP